MKVNDMGSEPKTLHEGDVVRTDYGTRIKIEQIHGPREVESEGMVFLAKPEVVVRVVAEPDMEGV